MKNKIRKLIRKSGFDIIRVDNRSQTLFYDDVYEKTYSPTDLQNKLFYNIGAGPLFNHKYWTNIDLISDWYKNSKVTAINYDLFSLEPLPIKSNSAKIFYTSHVIEHISNEAALNMFSEVYKALSPEGIFRVTCPDAELAWGSVVRKDRYFFEKLYLKNFNSKENLSHQGMTLPFSEMSNIQKFITQVCTARSEAFEKNKGNHFSDEKLHTLINEKGFDEALDVLCSTKNNSEIINYQKDCYGFHMNWWTKNKVMKFLKVAGFKNIVVSARDQSFNPVLRDERYFDNTEPKLSLYIEAIK